MKSILVIGLGRFGRHMAIKFLELGNEVMAIEKNAEIADDAVSYITNVQIGDATNEAFMESLGINNFDICVVAIGDNFQSALEATVLIKDLGGKFILARASSDVHRKLLLRNGADIVSYGEREMAERLAVKYGSKNVFDYIELTSEYSIYEISVPTSWRGKTILEKAVRSRYHVSILAIKQGEKIYPLPRPEHVFSQEETLIVMGHKNDVQELIR